MRNPVIPRWLETVVVCLLGPVLERIADPSEQKHSCYCVQVYRLALRESIFGDSVGWLEILSVLQAILGDGERNTDQRS
jgi:hypothetical protein